MYNQCLITAASSATKCGLPFLPLLYMGLSCYEEALFVQPVFDIPHAKPLAKSFMYTSLNTGSQTACWAPTFPPYGYHFSLFSDYGISI